MVEAETARARGGLANRFHHFDGRVRCCTKLPELPYARKYSGFERSYCRVERFNGAYQPFSQVIEAAPNGLDSVIQFLAEITDSLGVFGDGFLLPAIRDGLEEAK